MSSKRSISHLKQNTGKQDLASKLHVLPNHSPYSEKNITFSSSITQKNDHVGGSFRTQKEQNNLPCFCNAQLLSLSFAAPMLPFSVTVRSSPSQEVHILTWKSFCREYISMSAEHGQSFKSH